MKLWNCQTSFEAAREGIELLFPWLWRCSLALTGDRSHADELAQAACLRALEKVHQFEPGTNLDRWIFRLTHKVWINELRKQAVRVGGGLATLTEIGLASTNPDPEDHLLGREVFLAVVKLPEALRVDTEAIKNSFKGIAKTESYLLHLPAAPVARARFGVLVTAALVALTAGFVAGFLLFQVQEPGWKEYVAAYQAL